MKFVMDIERTHYLQQKDIFLQNYMKSFFSKEGYILSKKIISLLLLKKILSCDNGTILPHRCCRRWLLRGLRKPIIPILENVTIVWRLSRFPESGLLSIDTTFYKTFSAERHPLISLPSVSSTVRLHFDTICFRCRGNLPLRTKENLLR